MFVMVEIDVRPLAIKARSSFNITVQGDAPDRMRLDEFLPSNDNPGQNVKFHSEQ